MMSRKFHVLSVAAVLILLVVWGVLTYSLSSAQVNKPTSNEFGQANNGLATLVVARPLSTPLAPTPAFVENEIVVERPSATPEPTPNLGTAENPETDPDKIFAQVKVLVERYDNTVVGQAGWFYRRSESSSPPELMSNTGEIFGVPVSELNPGGTLLGHEWLLVDVNGEYDQSVLYNTDQAGTIRGGLVNINGKSVHFPFARITSEAIYDQPPIRSIALGETTINYFKEVLPLPNNSVTAWREGNSYILVLNYDTSAFKLWDNSDVLVVGGRTQYWFDLTSGAIQQHESYLRDAEGNFIFQEHGTNLGWEYVTELPSEATALLEEAAQLVAAMNE
jgi:hypothetical protein